MAKCRVFISTALFANDSTLSTTARAILFNVGIRFGEFVIPFTMGLTGIVPTVVTIVPTLGYFICCIVGMSA